MKVRVTKKLSGEPIVVPIRTEFIKLQDLMNFENVSESGGMAMPFIEEEQLTVSGEVCSTRWTQLRPGDTVGFMGNVWAVSQEEA